MTAGKFFRLFCIFLLIGAGLQELVEMLLNLAGLSSTGMLTTIFASMLEESTVWNLISIVITAAIITLALSFFMIGPK